MYKHWTEDVFAESAEQVQRKLLSTAITYAIMTYNAIKSFIRLVFINKIHWVPSIFLHFIDILVSDNDIRCDSIHIKTIYNLKKLISPNHSDVLRVMKNTKVDSFIIRGVRKAYFYISGNCMKISPPRMTIKPILFDCCRYFNLQ